MEYKRIVVLANSIKKGGRCVAGRMLRGHNIGEWIRPISEEPEGTLLSRHMVMDDRKPLRILDVVRIPIRGNAGDSCHPEDWQIGSQPWRCAGRFPQGDLATLEEFPNNLWVEDTRRTDRVGCEFLLSQKRHQSLYLIRPENLVVRQSREHNPWKGYTQKKTRALFTYAGTEFNFSLTDPVATDNLCTEFPEVGEPAIELQFPFEDRCLLCVSLTPMFEGFHYKVVAAVVELT